MFIRKKQERMSFKTAVERSAAVTRIPTNLYNINCTNRQYYESTFGEQNKKNNII